MKAIALRAPGRFITVLERSQLLTETGALISLQPNASKILTAWGVDDFLKKYGPTVDDGFRFFDQDGKLQREIKFQHSEFGADRVLYHRQDLHQGLLEAAKSDTLPGEPVQIRIGSPVQGCDPENGTVTLAEGELLKADLIIGADGVRSVVRTTVVGKPWPAVPTGLSAYRLLIPTSDMMDLHIPEDSLDPRKPLTTFLFARDRRVIMGPGRGGKVFGIVALVPDSKMQENSSDDSWVTGGSVDALLAAFQDFPDWLLRIFKRAPDHALWQLRDIEPLPTWVRGNTILIGDAAHAMLPTQGQGASQSIEDGEALKAYLADLGDQPAREDIEGALESVFQSRYDRASYIQQVSRDQAKPPAEQAIKFNPLEFTKYNCDYNGAKEWVARSTKVIA
jgi:salicylate hydroxylase